MVVQFYRSSCREWRGLVIFMATFAVQAAVAAGPVKLECPAAIEERSLHIVDTPAGWTTYVGAPLYLHGAAPMSGAPEQLGELADFAQTRRKDTWIYTYRLDGKFPKGKWLACTYGESDQITLSKKLDDKVQSCTFTYQKGRYVGQNDIKIRCD